MLGYDAPDEILALDSVIHLIAPHDRDRLVSFHAARTNGQAAPVLYEYEAIRRDGSYIFLQQNISVIDWDGQPAILSTVVDITDRKKAELALQASEQRYFSVVASMVEGVVLHQPDGAIIFANSAAEEILGLTVHQMMGRTPMDPRWRSIHEDGTPYPGETHPAAITLRPARPCATQLWVFANRTASCVGFQSIHSRYFVRVNHLITP